jgi:hypothetical protein
MYLDVCFSFLYADKTLVEMWQELNLRPPVPALRADHATTAGFFSFPTLSNFSFLFRKTINLFFTIKIEFNGHLSSIESKAIEGRD